MCLATIMFAQLVKKNYGKSFDVINIDFHGYNFVRAFSEEKICDNSRKSQHLQMNS